MLLELPSDLIKFLTEFLSVRDIFRSASSCKSLVEAFRNVEINQEVNFSTVFKCLLKQSILHFKFTRLMFTNVCSCTSKLRPLVELKSVRLYFLDRIVDWINLEQLARRNILQKVKEVTVSFTKPRICDLKTYFQPNFVQTLNISFSSISYVRFCYNSLELLSVFSNLQNLSITFLKSLKVLGFNLKKLRKISLNNCGHMFIDLTSLNFSTNLKFIFINSQKRQLKTLNLKRFNLISQMNPNAKI